ncbi:MAG: hypothetical protein R6V75_12345 [Bacteroidales bacterium]
MGGMKRPFTLYILVLLLFIQAISALYGGFGLIYDPTGEYLQLPPEIIEKLPFESYLVPGLILGFLLGLVPLLLIYPLLARPHWPWAHALNIYRNRHWAWTYSLYIGLGIIIWIDVQILLMGYQFWIQSFVAFLGLLILIFTLMPGVMSYYRRSRKPENREP